MLLYAVHRNALFVYKYAACLLVWLGRPNFVVRMKPVLGPALVVVLLAKAPTILRTDAKDLRREANCTLLWLVIVVLPYCYTALCALAWQTEHKHTLCDVILTAWAFAKGSERHCRHVADVTTTLPVG